MKLERILHSFLTDGIDLERARDRARADTNSDEMCARYARSAAFRAFVLGLPGGLLAPVAGLLDAGGSISLRTELAVVLLMRDDPQLLDDPNWKNRVVRAAYALPDDVGGLDAVAKRALVDELVRRGARFVARRVAVKIAPVAGSVVSASLAYAWMRREGRRISNHTIESHEPPSPARKEPARSVLGATRSAVRAVPGRTNTL